MPGEVDRVSPRSREDGAPSGELRRSVGGDVARGEGQALPRHVLNLRPIYPITRVLRRVMTLGLVLAILVLIFGTFGLLFLIAFAWGRG